MHGAGFGTPSGDIVRGRLHDHEVLFIARHGQGHRLLPHEVNCRANVFAFKPTGATMLLGFSAVGGLSLDVAPGTPAMARGAPILALAGGQAPDLRRPAKPPRRRRGVEGLCAVDMPRDAVPFVERQLLRQAESRTGQSLPTATLCCAWDPSWPSGTVVPNAYNRRVR